MIAPPTIRIVTVCPIPHTAPITAEPRKLCWRLHDGRDHDDMIGIGRVANAEQKSQEKERR